jgi:hypothetical protein
MAPIGAWFLSLFLKQETARRFAMVGFIAVLILTAIAGYGAFQVWDYFDDRAAVNADRAQSKAEATERARKADERARGASEAIPDKVEKENAKARTDARNSDDPLRAGFDSLRSEARGDSDAASDAP